MLLQNKILEPLLQTLNSFPNRVVLNEGKKNITAKWLWDSSEIIAQQLASKGLSAKDTVLLAIEPGIEFLQVFYALLKLKVKIAIIDPEMGAQNYFSKMQQLQASWLFIDNRLLFISRNKVLQSLIDKIKSGLPRLATTDGMEIITTGRYAFLNRKYDSFCNLLRATNHHYKFPEGNYENLIAYTSGTVALPKGVVHTDVSLSESLRLMADLLPKSKNDVLGTYLPHFMLLGIAANYEVKLVPKSMDGKLFYNTLKQQKITVYFGPPVEYLPLIDYCEKSNLRIPDSVAHLIIGSAPVHKRFLLRLIKVLPTHCRVSCTYGMTEHLMTCVADGRAKALYNKEGDLLGKPVSGVEIKIANDSEIFVRSTQLFKRYLYEEKGKQWHGSGDLGFFDSEGQLVLIGRKKDMIIRRNMNIYPALYEDTIKKIDGIDEAVMIGVYDESIFDEKVFLIVKTEVLCKDEIKKAISFGPFGIDKEALPDEIILMDIPHKGRQKKIDREYLRKFLKDTYL